MTRRSNLNTKMRSLVKTSATLSVTSHFAMSSQSMNTIVTKHYSGEKTLKLYCNRRRCRLRFPRLQMVVYTP